MGLIEYIKETKVEMSHVSWPTRRQAIMYTALVIAIALIISAYLGLFDYLFSKGISSLVDFGPSAPLDGATSTDATSSTTTTNSASSSIKFIDSSDVEITPEGEAIIHMNE